ncbi:transcriptional regulator [Cystobacter fuscus]|uniref:Transcriptional regulator n=1 Tax=Cystobacter fuscus TaxID=43 RepID=A0A250J164_9BACT|nr:helix-turn-helix domain-containing protein [Cystobacter fuscus]ATB37187.1 transcriptional regulator [Cystobacter fuscus]
MARTPEKAGYSPKRKLPPSAAEETGPGSPGCSLSQAQEALKLLEGRWKLVILFHLFHTPVLRFSELERGIPGVSQKMLIQQLRELERDGLVVRTVHPQVPPKVEYSLTGFGQALLPTLRALRDWAALRKTPALAERG